MVSKKSIIYTEAVIFLLDSWGGKLQVILTDKEV